jgi:hypothetical protein
VYTSVYVHSHITRQRQPELARASQQRLGHSSPALARTSRPEPPALTRARRGLRTVLRPRTQAPA